MFLLYFSNYKTLTFFGKTLSPQGRMWDEKKTTVNMIPPSMTERLLHQTPLWFHMYLMGLLYISFLSLLTVALSLSSCQAEVEKRMGVWLLGHGRMRPQREDSHIRLQQQRKKENIQEYIDCLGVIALCSSSVFVLYMLFI